MLTLCPDWQKCMFPSWLVCFLWVHSRYELFVFILLFQSFLLALLPLTLAVWLIYSVFGNSQRLMSFTLHNFVLTIALAHRGIRP